MDRDITTAVLQTPTPGVGPEEIFDLWPLVLRAAWFAAGFLVVLLVGRYAVQPVIGELVRRRNNHNQTIQEAISRYVQLFVVVVAVFVGVAFAGYGQILSNSALVIAALTLAVGVAGQAVIGSLISGLVLVLDPEFNIGDYIVWENGEGRIRSISLRITRVQTQNGEMVTIPNTVLTGQAITRPYSGGRFQVRERVGLAYEADVDEALSVLSEVASDQESIARAPSPGVYVDEFGDDALLVSIHYWIEDPRPGDIFEIRSTYAREAKTRLEAAGIEISPASERELRGRIEVGDTAS